MEKALGHLNNTKIILSRIRTDEKQTKTHKLKTKYVGFRYSETRFRILIREALRQKIHLLKRVKIFF